MQIANSVIALLRSSTPSGRGGRFPWGTLLCVAGFGALVYGTLVYAGYVLTAQPGAPGWRILTPCSYTVSFDGSRSLLLSEDSRASIHDRSSSQQEREDGETGTNGTWSFESGTRKLSLNVGGATHVYTLVSPAQVGTCMLVRGNMESANLRESWFSPDPGDFEDTAPQGNE